MVCQHGHIWCWHGGVRGVSAWPYLVLAWWCMWLVGMVMSGAGMVVYVVCQQVISGARMVMYVVCQHGHVWCWHGGVCDVSA